jgi:membrane glycosyltransferase
LWLLQLIVGIIIVLQAKFIRPEYFTSGFSLFPSWPRFDAERSLTLFGATMGILLAPKLFGLLVTLARSDERRASGGFFTLIGSTLLEVILSALLAPIMMVIQSGAVMNILSGRDTGWNPQRRDDGSIPMRDILRRHRTHMALGVVSGIAAFLIAPSLFAWMSPTIIGLLLAVPISWASGQLAIGLWLKRRRLLQTPEESNPPPIAGTASAIIAELASAEQDDIDGLRLMHADAAFREAHVAMLPAFGKRRRGDIDHNRAVAVAKLGDADSIAEATHWLNQPKERMTVLRDAALLSMLAKLPAESPENDGLERPAPV